VATFTNRSKDLFSIVVDVDPVDIHSGSHDVADAAIANIESPLHHLLLRLLQQAPFLTRRDQQLQLFRRVQGFLNGSGTQTEEQQHEIAQTVERALSRCRRSVAVNVAGNRRHAVADAAAQVRNEPARARNAAG
jgi:ElaB/YqjD/DUF883 family membrane-anchored ribosome-binding protein